MTISFSLNLCTIIAILLAYRGHGPLNSEQCLQFPYGPDLRTTVDRGTAVIQHDQELVTSACIQVCPREEGRKKRGFGLSVAISGGIAMSSRAFSDSLNIHSLGKVIQEIHLEESLNY